MKKHLLILGIIGLCAVALITSCKKENATLDPKVEQFNTDANNYKSEVDQADNDINNALGDIPAFKNGGEMPEILSSPLCGVTIDSSQIAQKILFFNFDGVTSCFSPSRLRSGQIKVQLTSGTHWSDPGAVLTETFINFKITRQSDNKSIMFNGVKTLKNINGNDWIAFLLSTKSLKYQERAFNIAVTFDNNLNATWNSARTTEWNYVKANVNPGIQYAHITFTAKGDTTINGFNSADTWGVNRYGYGFTTYYNSPLLSNTYCGLWRFTSGELVHHVNNEDFMLTLGVDVDGNPTPSTCAYGFKVTWTSSGKTNSVILSY
ncbi:MAG: hypothetical protein ABI723_16260 [Bacteroidia bacterium]